MKTYLFFESSLPTFAGPFSGIYFVLSQGEGHASLDSLRQGGACIAAPPPPPVLIATDLCHPCKSFQEPHAIVTHQVLVEGNLGQLPWLVLVM